MKHETKATMYVFRQKNASIPYCEATLKVCLTIYTVKKSTGKLFYPFSSALTC